MYSKIFVIQIVLAIIAGASEVNLNKHSNPETFLFTKVGTVGHKTFYAELLTLMTWKDAHIFCRGKSMFLASITTEEEKSLLRTFFASVELPANSDFWLSGTDYGSAGIYYWMDSGHLIEGEPAVVGNGTCTDATNGGGCRTSICSCENKCSCGRFCSGNCVKFQYKSSVESIIGVGGCTGGRRFVCQQLN